jgi:hypothetical protein
MLTACLRHINPEEEGVSKRALTASEDKILPEHPPYIMRSRSNQRVDWSLEKNGRRPSTSMTPRREELDIRDIYRLRDSELKHRKGATMQVCRRMQCADCTTARHTRNITPTFWGPFWTNDVKLVSQYSKRTKMHLNMLVYRCT